MLTPPTTADLANMLKVEEASFTDYVETALFEATLLFQLATEITEWPTEEMDLLLAQRAVLKMADLCYLENDNRELDARGLQSESFPHYSYTRAAKAVKSGTETGIVWWDMAVSRLTEGTDNIRIAHSGIHGHDLDLPDRPARHHHRHRHDQRYSGWGRRW